MPTLNADIPRFYCLIRKEFLYNLEAGTGEFVGGCVFGVASVNGMALGFHVLLENGAVVWRLPIHALVWRLDAPRLPIDWLQLWDCFSYDLAVTEFEHLQGMRCGVYLKDAKRYGGQYQFTVDWYNSAASEDTGDGGHKCAHVVKLDNGCFAAQPNNRMVWFEPATVVPFDNPPDYITNTHTWKVEQGSKWATSDDRKMFYDVSERTKEAEDGV